MPISASFLSCTASRSALAPSGEICTTIQREGRRNRQSRCPPPIAAETYTPQLRAGHFRPQRGLRRGGVAAKLAGALLHLLRPRAGEREAGGGGPAPPAARLMPRVLRAAVMLLSLSVIGCLSCVVGGGLPHAPFQADAQQLLRSTANSIGSCCNTSLAKPLTISATAAS
jgi:hypothetical protein